jgi:cbb3-type cytochrome oxidase cytochrome c subunit
MNKRRSISHWSAVIFEGGIRVMVGCFVFGIVFFLVATFAASWHFNPLRGRLPPVGPRLPIPKVDAETLAFGRSIYQREDCNGCHTLADADTKDGRDEKRGYSPDLTHEGQRNASIDWQIANLQDHHRLYPNSIMPDYNDLPSNELRALASFLAARK